MSFIKDMLLKKMLKSQLKGVPEDQQDMIITAVQKNPALFEKIALEVQELTKQGKDQTSATMEVMRKYQAELAKAIQK